MSSDHVVYFAKSKDFGEIMGPMAYDEAVSWLTTKGFEKIDNFVWKKSDVFLFHLQKGRETSRSAKIEVLWAKITHIRSSSDIDCRVEGEFNTK